MSISGIIEFAYVAAVLAVIGGHLFFAYGQWFKWPKLCEALTNLRDDEVERTAFLGRSFASYNASIALGLALSFLIEYASEAGSEDAPQMGAHGAIEDWVQGVVLVLIVATAAVGASGTKTNTILKFRLLPAAVALALLLVGLLL